MQILYTCWSALPLQHRVPIVAEFEQVKTWTSINNLRLNSSKTRESGIYRNKPSIDPLDPPILAGAVRVESMRVLGVEVEAHLAVGTHLNAILSSSASFIHALLMLQSHGLPKAAVQGGGSSDHNCLPPVRLSSLVGLHNHP